MTLLESDLEKLKIQALLTQDLAEKQPELVDLSLNTEFDRLAWMLTMEEINPRLKSMKSWQLRKKIIRKRGRAIAINQLGSLAQISLASSEKEEDTLPRL